MPLIKIVGTKGVGAKEKDFLKYIGEAFAWYDFFHGKGVAKNFELSHKMSRDIAKIKFKRVNKQLVPEETMTFKPKASGSAKFDVDLKPHGTKRPADDPDCYWVWDDDQKMWIQVGDC